VRATDSYSNTSQIGPLTVLIDRNPPLAWIEPATVITRAGRLDGLAYDPAPRSFVDAVYVKIDSAPWARVGTLSAILDDDENQPWTHLWSPTRPEDHITHTVWISATDSVGNVSAVSGPYTVTVDNVLPAVTFDRLETDVINTDNLFLMGGTVSDGSGLRSLTARVILPDGSEMVEPLELESDVWRYVRTVPFTLTGDLVVFLNFGDQLGNETTWGPYPLRVSPDVALTQAVMPAVVSAGETITYTLAFTSFDTTTDVVITFRRRASQCAGRWQQRRAYHTDQRRAFAWSVGRCIIWKARHHVNRRG
jgi:hypothetical protein